jgi:hypothetical protein
LPAARAGWQLLSAPPIWVSAVPSKPEWFCSPGPEHVARPVRAPHCIRCSRHFWPQPLLLSTPRRKAA